MGRRRGPTPPRPWGDWLVAGGAVHRSNGEPAEIEDGVELLTNGLYNVHRRRIPSADTAIPDIVHLSICRLDRKPVRDWRHLQRIKNELVGPDREGVEIYPAEDRLVDAANQYHLWVFDRPGWRLPFGFADRLVLDAADAAAAFGAVQRPLDAP